MKRLLTILAFIIIVITSNAQQHYKPSLQAGPQNKPSGISSATPLDSRSYFYDTLTFSYRPYANRAEVLSYLYLASYRSGQFTIIIDSISNKWAFWFRNGTADSNLVLQYNFASATTDSSVFATLYRVDTAKVNLRASIAGKISTTLNAGQILVGNISNVATAVTPGNDVSVTSGGSFTVLNQWKLVGNAGTTDLTNFIGTTDNVPLSFKVNGFLAGRIDHLNANAFLGYRAGRLTTAANNSALGHGSLLVNTSGGGNTAIGAQSLFSSTFGSNNTSIGYNSLLNNTTGVSNTALGYNTAGGLTTGNYNTIIGANITGLTGALNNNIILADGQGIKRLTIDSFGTSVLPSTTALGLPVGNTAQRPSSPAIGYIRYNTDSVNTETWDGSIWVKAGSGGGGGGGSVTNVGTGLWLSGGPITGTGTIIADSAGMATYFLRRKDSTVTGYQTHYDSDTARTNIYNALNGKQPTGNYITALTGPITAAGPGSAATTITANAITTTTINNNAVTYAKIQAMTANKLLGSGASGTAVAEITLGTNLSFTGTTLNASGGGSTDTTSLSNRITANANYITHLGLQNTTDTLYGFGDSYWYGNGQIPTWKSIAGLTAGSWGKSENNLSQGGRGLWYGVAQANSNIPIDNNNSVHYMLGLNDLRNTGATTKTLSMFITGNQSIIATTWSKTAVPANSSAITKTGSWTDTATAALGGRSGFLGGLGVKTSSTGATASWPFNGGNIVLGFIGTDSSLSVGGTFNLLVDDSIVLNVNVNNRTNGVSDGTNQCDRMGAVVFVFGLGEGSHTAKVITTNSTQIYLDYFGTLKGPGESVPIFTATPPKMTATGYGIFADSAQFAKGDSMIRVAVAPFLSLNYPVAVVNSNQYYTPIPANVLSDSVHPSQAGAALIAQAFIGNNSFNGIGGLPTRNGQYAYQYLPRRFIQFGKHSVDVTKDVFGFGQNSGGFITWSMNNPAATANNRLYDTYLDASDNTYNWRVINDAQNTSNDILKITRSGTTISTIHSATQHLDIDGYFSSAQGYLGNSIETVSTPFAGGNFASSYGGWQTYSGQGATDEHKYRFYSDLHQAYFDAINDAGGSAGNIYTINRTGITVNYLTFGTKIGVNKVPISAMDVVGHGVFSTGITAGVGTAGTQVLNIIGNSTLDSGTTFISGNTVTSGQQGSSFRVKNSRLLNSFTASSNTVPIVSGSAFIAPTFAALNASVTNTVAATVYIDSAAHAGTNITNTDSFALYVNKGKSYFGSALQIKDGTQGANKILTSDANGLASWQTASFATQSALNDTAAALRAAIGTGGSDTLKLKKAGTGEGLLFASGDTLNHKALSNATTLSDSSLQVNTLEKADQTLTGNRNVLGASHTLNLGTSGSKITSLFGLVSNQFTFISDGGAGSTVDPGSGSTLSVGNSGATTLLKGGVELSTLFTATDANTGTLVAYTAIILPDITANRTFQLSGSVGKIYIVMHRNSTGFTWSPTGITIKDGAGNTISSLVNGKTYILYYDGTNYISVLSN